MMNLSAICIPYLEPMAQEKVSENPKARDNTITEKRLKMSTGFRPTLSPTYPMAYPLKKRPNQKALAM